MPRYSLVDHMRHVARELLDAEKWHDALGHFQTERERAAYRAGFVQGAGKARAMISLHAGFTLDDSRQDT